MPKTSDQQKERGEAEAAGHVLAHWIRVDILTALHEGPACQAEIAEEFRLPLSKIGHHFLALIENGAIEVAFSKKVGNVDQHFYRATMAASYEPEELALLTPEEHQMLSRIIVQSISAELLGALRAGKLSGDPYAATAWDRLTLDEIGYKALNENIRGFFDRCYEIAGESANRLGKSGEPGKVYIASALGFERSRSEPNTRANVGHIGVNGVPPGGIFEASK